MKPVKHVIIGTAGHVDHGKTELVRALTGRDTDRLAEEKARGISIVLGFAPIDLGAGIEAGIVDVPGHERFVKNMVSGAVGVDIALIAVAADEGVMPQTEEHFEVLRLLGVTSGVVAVTKTDLVDEEIAAVAQSEVADMLRGTPLEGAVFVRTSAVTGRGIEELRAALSRCAAEAAAKARGEFFRLPVDRVFTRSGIGTIITGTTWSGAAAAGDELVIEPQGLRVRVREVQSFDRDLDETAPGMRTALAVHGARVEQVSAGDQVLSPGALPVSPLLDVRLEMSRLPGSRLRTRQRVRFHHAAAEILGRVVLIGGGELGPSAGGYALLRLERPVAAAGGDRFVLRTYSPQRILAGGRILDPAPGSAKRARAQERLALLEVLDSGQPRRMAEALARRAGPAGLDPATLVRYGIGSAAATGALEALEEGGAVARDGAAGPGQAGGQGGGRFFHREVAEEYRGRIMELLERFGAENRLVWGIDREELRGKADLAGMPLFEYLLARGVREGELFFKAGKVRAGSAELELSAADSELLGRLGREIEEAGVRFAMRQDLLARVTGDERRLARCLHILQERGEVVRLAPDGYISATVLAGVREGVARMIAEAGAMSVGDFKERFDISRKFAVPLLEHLDQRGYTQRDGDLRRAGPALREEEG